MSMKLFIIILQLFIYEAQRESELLANSQAQYMCTHSTRVLDECVLILGIEAGERLFLERMLIAVWMVVGL